MNSLKISEQVYRIKEGSVLFGVWRGHEICGKGKANLYRIISIIGVVTVFASWLFLIIYFVSAATMPVAKNKEDMIRLKKLRIKEAKELEA